MAQSKLLVLGLTTAPLIILQPFGALANAEPFTVECTGTAVLYNWRGKTGETPFTDRYTIDLERERYANLANPTKVRMIKAIKDQIVVLRRLQDQYLGRPLYFSISIDMSDWSYTNIFNNEREAEEREGTCSVVELVPLGAE